MRKLGLFLIIFFSVISEASINGTVGIEAGTYPVIGIFFATRPQNTIGFYGDLKGSLPFVDDKNIYKFNSLYAETVLNDQYLKTIKSLGYFDGGITMTFTDWLDGFAGLGIGSQTTYRNYLDRYGILGDGGKYYIQTKNSVLFNAQVGLLFYINRISIRASFDTGGPSFNFGLGYVF